MMNKPKGLDIVVGLGRPRPGGPPKPPPGIDNAPVMDDMPDDEEQEEQGTDSKLDKIYACLQRIEKALGLDEPGESETPPEGEETDDQSGPPQK